MASLYPNTGTMKICTLMQTGLATSKMRLFKDGLITLTPLTTLAELVAAECDYTGYTAGGQAITAWNAPLLQAGGGAGITSPTIQFAAGTPYTVGNVVGGGWIEDTGGVLWFAWKFDSAVPIGASGQGVPVSVTLIQRN